jgi:hypothetical protein
MEDFVGKIKFVWKYLVGNLREFSPLQFQQNLKEEIKVVVYWARDKMLKNDKVLREVEEALEVLYNREGFGLMNEEQNNEVKVLEHKRQHILWEKEKEWRLNIKALWLHVRDDNTKKFTSLPTTKNI